MIHIVTGRINSGKSTTICDIYNKNKVGDGFVSVKRMHYDKVHGYDIVRLSTRDTKLLVVRDEYKTKDYDIACQIGPYQFLTSTLSYINTEITSMLEQGIEPIYLDEIGQLELNNQCFHSIFETIVQAKVNCYITVRTQLVQDVISKYQLHDYDIIEV